MRISFYFPCCIARQIDKLQMKCKRTKPSKFLFFIFLILITLSTTRDYLLSLGLMCSPDEVRTELDTMCVDMVKIKEEEASYISASKLFTKYNLNLCDELCSPQSSNTLNDRISCHNGHLSKSLVFTIDLIDQSINNEFKSIVVKSLSKSYEENITGEDTDESYWKDSIRNPIIPNKVEFIGMLTYYATLVMGDSNIENLGFDTLLESANMIYDSNNNIMPVHKMFWKFILDQEIFMMIFFANTHMFPRLIGVCNNLYAVEEVTTLPETILVSSSLKRDEKLLKAISIVKYVEKLNTIWHEPLHLCDVKISHFGFTRKGTVKFVDMDAVMTDHQLKDSMKNTPTCESDEDCSFFDCHAKCDRTSSKCIPLRVNTNLQVVCSRVFLGEGSSPIVSVIGLLNEEKEHVSDALLLCKTNPGMTAETLLQVLYQAYNTQNA